MAYTRPPTSIVTGRALRQDPSHTDPNPVGAVPVTLEAMIASTTDLGVVQVGSGLVITEDGLLSATGGGQSGTFRGNVTLTSVNYNILATDFYIGATRNGITITLPLGVLGQVYVIKNQVPGSVTLRGSGGQRIDGASSVNISGNSADAVIFTGSEWSLIGT